MMDARLQIGNEYVLKLFTCANPLNQWDICLHNTPIFSANIVHDDDVTFSTDFE
jgi:hypothetical protein